MVEILEQIKKMQAADKEAQEAARRARETRKELLQMLVKTPDDVGMVVDITSDTITIHISAEGDGLANLKKSVADRGDQ